MAVARSFDLIVGCQVGYAVCDIAPNLLHAVARRHLSQLVAEALPENIWVGHITGPLTMQVIAEYLQSLGDSPDGHSRGICI